MARALLASAIACARPLARADVAHYESARSEPSSETLSPSPASCGRGRQLTVHFYDVGEASSALIDLPDGRHVLVDTGDGSHRTGCAAPCQAADRHLIDGLTADLKNAPLDLVWVTHQHADHIGGVPDVLDAFRALAYVDNGRDANRPEVRRAHTAADRKGTPRFVVDPGHFQMPIQGAAPELALTPIVPPVWPASCAHDANECSIGLRIDFCSSSLLFVGDAEHDEEATLDLRGPVTLLQVAHHGSETSTTPGFLARSRPKYAVISAGKPGEGYNRAFCHPRARIVQRLTKVLAGGHRNRLEAFDGDRCDQAGPADWIAVPASDSLWATERDGDVVLTTAGDGTFRRERP